MKITMERDEKKIKPQLGKYYLLSLSILLIVILVIYFTTLKVDPTEYFKYLTELKTTVLNDKLLQLTNANTIYNLPDVTLQTDNSDINALVSCKNNIKYIGEYTLDNILLKNYRQICKNSCGGSGELLLVEKQGDYVYDNKFVESGVYCTVEPPNCNHNTGYVVATVNSATCKSKYPRMFGGATSSTIIACNDEDHPSTGSVLWDYANNEPVDPSTVNMTHEDETLPDGSFRFRCKYNETQNKNPYLPHPLDRLHPIVDKCNDTIYAADYSVHAKITEAGWECDCGTFTDTRVKHLDESNPKSICTSCYREKDGDNYTIPYLCFKETAPYTMPHDYTPCIDYADSGNLCSTTTLKLIPSDDDEFFLNTSMYGEITADKLTLNHRVYHNI